MEMNWSELLRKIVVVSKLVSHFLTHTHVYNIYIYIYIFGLLVLGRALFFFSVRCLSIFDAFGPMLLIEGFKQFASCVHSISEQICLMDSSSFESLWSVRLTSLSIAFGDFLKKLLFLVTRLLPHLEMFMDPFCCTTVSGDERVEDFEIEASIIMTVLPTWMLLGLTLYFSVFLHASLGVGDILSDAWIIWWRLDHLRLLVFQILSK